MATTSILEKDGLTLNKDLTNVKANGIVNSYQTSASYNNCLITNSVANRKLDKSVTTDQDVAGKVTFSSSVAVASVDSDLVPTSTNTKNLGSDSNRWDAVYGDLANDPEGTVGASGAAVSYYSPSESTVPAIKVPTIYGQSRAWNQLWGNYGTAYPNTVSITKNADNDYTITSLASGKSGYEYDCRTTDHVTVSGHKYLICAYINPSFAVSTFAVYLRQNINFSVSLTANRNNFIAKIATCGSLTYDYPELQFSEMASQSTGATVRVQHVILRDLTAMFGAGNEPATAEEALAAIPDLALFDSYNASYMVDSDINAIESDSRNLIKSYSVSNVYGQYAVCLRAEFDIQPSTQYTISFVGVAGNAIYVNENLTTTYCYIDCDGTRQSITFTTKSSIPWNEHDSSQGGWILFKNRSSKTVANFSDIQIEKGATATEYHPYVLDSSPLPSSIVLKSAGNVKDEYIPETGEIIRRVKTNTYRGASTESWSTGSTGYYIVLNDMAKLSNYSGAIFCDKLAAVQHQAAFVTQNLEITGYYDSNLAYPLQNWLYVVVGSNVSSVSDLKTWLASNPITVNYALAVPYKETVTPIASQIQTQDGGKVVLAQTQTPAIDPTFDVVIPSQVSTINDVAHAETVATKAINLATQNRTDMVDTSTNQTINGNKTFNGNTSLGTTTIAETTINGTLDTRSNVILGSASDANTVVTLNSKIINDVVPNENKAYDLGSPTARWDGVYGTLKGTDVAASDSSVYLNRKTAAGNSSLESDAGRLMGVTGGSVALNQKSEYRIGYWLSNYGSMTLTDSIFTYTPVNTNLNSAGIYTQQLTTGKVYYAYAEVNPTFTCNVKFFGASAISATGGLWTGKSILIKPGSNTTSVYCEISSSWFNGSTALGTIKIRNIKLINLNQMLGDDIANGIWAKPSGEGIKYFNSIFSAQSVHDYSTGEVVNTELESREATEWNLWDEEWETGAISGETGQNVDSNNSIRSVGFTAVTPGNTYYVKGTLNIRVRAYNGDKEFVGVVYNGYNSSFSISDNSVRYIRFDVPNITFYQNDICINLTQPDTTHYPYNGIYLPYNKQVNHFDSNLILRGVPKWDSTNGKMYYDGDVYRSDGTVLRKYGIVDLGTLSYEQATTSTSGSYRFQTAISAIPAKVATNDNTVANIISSKFAAITATNTAQNIEGVAISSTGRVIVYGDAYKTLSAASFKAAMSGVYLVYELATPYTELAAPYSSQVPAYRYGTESIITRNEPSALPYISTDYLSQVGSIDTVGNLQGISESAYQGVFSTDAGPVREDTWLAQESNVEDDTTVRIKKLKGKSYGWNQFANLTAFTNGNCNSSINGAKVTLTINNAPSAPDNYVCTQLRPVEYYVNHVYLIMCDYDCSSLTNFKHLQIKTFSSQGLATFNANKGVASSIFRITTTNTDGRLQIVAYANDSATLTVGQSMTYSNLMAFDLTLIYGSGNEPTTVEQFRADFPDLYYEYTSGDLISSDPIGIYTTGINIWDEKWELGAYDLTTGKKTFSSTDYRCSNHIHIVPNTDYYCKWPGANSASSVVALFYDSKYNLLPASSSRNYLTIANSQFTPPINARYMTFYYAPIANYNHDLQICLGSLPDSLKNIYHSYCGVTTSIDIHKYFPTGLHSAGSVYDEIDYEHRVAIQRVGVVDLGDLSWSLVSGTTVWEATTSGTKAVSASTEYANLTCGKYLPSKEEYLSQRANEVAITTSGKIRVNTNSSSVTPTGSLYYELATPIIAPLDEPTPSYPVLKNGISTWLTSANQPTTVAINSARQYLTKAELIRNVSDVNSVANDAYNGLYSEAPSPRAEETWLTKESDVETDTQVKVDGFRGKSWAWNQLIKNGNFTQVTSGTPDYWGESYATTTTSSGVVEITPSAQHGGVISTSFKLTNGNKYLLTGDMKLSSSDANQSNRLRIYGNNSLIIGLSCPNDTDWHTLNTIFTASSTVTASVQIQADGSTYSSKFYARNCSLYNLTLIYGAGNEPTSVDQFRADFPAIYYDYNTGDITSTDPAGITTTGVNIWDECWEVGGIDESTGQTTSWSDRIRSKNYIPVVPNTRYGMATTQQKLIFYYDVNKSFIGTSGWQGSAIGFVTNAQTYYIKFTMIPQYGTSYKSDIQICLDSLPTYIKSKYHPYSGHTSKINIRKYFPTGLHSAGDVYDEIDYERGLAIQRVGVVNNIGRLGWYSGAGNTGITRFSTINLKDGTYPRIANAASNTSKANILCSHYDIITAGQTWSGSAVGIGEDEGGTVFVFDTRYNAASYLNDLKQYLDEATLYYKLATPIITPLEESTLVYPVFRDGQSSWLTSDSQPTAVPIIATLETQTKADAIRTAAATGANAFEALSKINDLITEYDLTASSWPAVGASSTYTVEGITPTSNQIIMVPNGSSSAETIQNAGFQVVGQDLNTITLKVNGTSPGTTTLTLHFLIIRT